MMCVNFAGNWKCIKVLYNSQNFSKHFNQSLVIYMWIMMKNCFFVHIAVKMWIKFWSYLPLHHKNFVIILIEFSIYLSVVIFQKWWLMLVSKWTRLWTSSCHLMASRLETRLSKGYWWVRLPRCPARTIGSTNYCVSCVHFRIPAPIIFHLLFWFRIMLRE